MRKYRGELVYQSRNRTGVIEVVQDGQTRSLHFGDATRQSSMSVQQPAMLVLSYTRDMMACLLFRPAPRSVLLVGLGGGSLAKFLLHHYPDCSLDAVEPRDDVVQVAHQHFALPVDPRLRVHLCDGISFAIQASPTLSDYDLVLIDAYDPGGMAPFVADAEFLSALGTRMSEEGVLAVNLSRPQRILYRESLRSLRRVFPRGVLRLPVVEKGNEVALGFRHPTRARCLRRLQDRASALENRLGIDFPDILQRLRRHNASLLDSLLSRGLRTED